MNGFSLRAYDPSRQHWSLLLFWTGDGNSSFVRLEGRFRHGRGEFLAGPPENLTRYTFFGALTDSVRWDSSQSSDRGVSCKTDWIEGRVSPHPEARQLDWLLGRWRGL